MENFKNQNFDSSYPTKISFLMILRGKALLRYGVFFLLVVISLILDFSDISSYGDIFLGLALGFLTILIFLITWDWLALKGKLLEGFAKSKGLTKKLDFKRSVSHPESIINLGRYRERRACFVDEAGDKVIELVYVTKHGNKEERDAISGLDITMISSRLRKKYPFAQALNKKLKLTPKHLIKQEPHLTESNEFNRNYYLNASTPQDAFYVFNPAVIDAIISQKNDISVEVCDDVLTVFTASPVKTIKELNEVWNSLLTIQDALE
jgi:hypothetical protein